MVRCCENFKLKATIRKRVAEREAREQEENTAGLVESSSFNPISLNPSSATGTA